MWSFAHVASDTRAAVSPALRVHSRRKNSGSILGSTSSFFTSAAASLTTSYVMAGFVDQYGLKTTSASVLFTTRPWSFGPDFGTRRSARADGWGAGRETASPATASRTMRTRTDIPAS